MAKHLKRTIIITETKKKEGNCFFFISRTSFSLKEARVPMCKVCVELKTTFGGNESLLNVLNFKQRLNKFEITKGQKLTGEPR